ncbi:MAG: diaminopimelate epimerase [Planctomycetota bacterium]|nr:diaminopimelate epimerase [Planctomycetota bacterium]
MRGFSGAGNRFVLVDEREECAGAAQRARAPWSASDIPAAADGTLRLVPPRAGGDARLEITNRDGSRAAACGNGLRCVGLYLFERGEIGARAARIETDAGERTVEIVRPGLAVAVLRAGMGRAEGVSLSSPVEHEGERFSAWAVRLGNPHLVLRVADERSAPVAALGRRLQSHPDFPDGVNVGFLARRDERWHLRVFERGVGETHACGSGACAAAWALCEAGEGAGCVEIQMAGGRLSVEFDPTGELFLIGDAREEDPAGWKSPRGRP